MNVHEARQRKTDLRWDYTCTNGSGVYALGYCATRPEGHPDGHDTAAEAEACYRLFQAREESLFGDRPDTQRKCRVCETWTTHEAVVGREFPAQYPLCPEHATLPHVEALHAPGAHPMTDIPRRNDTPLLTRRSDGAAFRIVLQARSPDGGVSLLGDAGPPFERVETTNDRLLVDFFDPRKEPSTPALARLAFEAYNASTGGKTWDGKDVPPYETIAERTPHVARAWEAAVDAVRRAVRP